MPQKLCIRQRCPSRRCRCRAAAAVADSGAAAAAAGYLKFIAVAARQR